MLPMSLSCVQLTKSRYKLSTSPFGLVVLALPEGHKLLEGSRKQWISTRLPQRFIKPNGHRPKSRAARFTAYRQLLPQGWNHVRKLLASCSQCSIRVGWSVGLRTDGLRQVIADGSTTMLGYVRVPASKGQKLQGCSGTKSFCLEFFQCSLSLECTTPMSSMSLPGPHSLNRSRRRCSRSAHMGPRKMATCHFAEMGRDCWLEGCSTCHCPATGRGK